MNKFAGTLTFKGGIDIEKLNYKKLIIPGENTSVFLFGETKLESELLIKSFEDFGELLAYDISHSAEDNINILNTDIDGDIYESSSFEGSEVNLRDISSRFLDSFEVICVRETEESDIFGNRIVKVDFIY